MPFPDSLQNPPPQVAPNRYLLPASIVRGDTFIFRYPDGSLYPSTGGWTFTLSLRGGGSAIDINSTTDGDFLLTATATATADWTAGIYQAQLYAVNTSPTRRETVLEAFIEVVTNYSAALAPVDVRSSARKILDAIESTMEGRAGSDILHSQIDNTAFGRMTPEQLQTAHSYWSAKVRSEEAKARAKAGLATGRTILTRFVSPR